MLTTRSPVGFVDTSQELQALLRGTRPHDVEPGGHDDVCSAAINVWTHYWTHPTTYMASETIDTLSGQWNPPGL